MSDGLRIDPDGLRAAAPAFVTLGDRMDDILRTLQGRIDAEGDCWGADDYGSAFIKDYVPAQESAVEFFPQVAGALRAIATGLTEVAATADRGEKATHDKFRA